MEWLTLSGLKKSPSGGPGQVDFLAGQVTLIYSLLAQWARVQVSHPLTKTFN